MKKEIYGYYEQRELNEEGTLIAQHYDALQKLSIKCELIHTEGLKAKINRNSEEFYPIMAKIRRLDRKLDHFITIADRTIHQEGEEWIPFANPLHGRSYLVSFDDFLRVSWHVYLRLLEKSEE